MSNKNSVRARKAVRTMQARRRFIDTWGQETFNALVSIARGTNFSSPARVRSMAAYKANLTRGTYSSFVTVDTNGNFRRDSIGVSRV